MADVSKLARARMAKTPVAGPHPDADLLTAFAERSATPAEREQVLAHLATCTECREVVALAAPEAVPLEQPVLVSRRSRWMPVGVFRWGTMAAAVAVVAIVVIVESPKYQPSVPSAMQADKMASKQPADAGFASNEPSKPKTSAAATPEAQLPSTRPQSADLKNEAGPTKKDEDHAATDRLASVAQAPAAPPPPLQATREKQTEEKELAKTQPSGAVTGGGLVRPAPAVAASNATLSADMATRKPAESGEVTGNLEAANSAPAKAKAAPARSEERAAYDSFSAAAPAAGAGTGVAINGQRDARQDASLRGVAYKWTVTSDGRVQRSADGRTWFFVPVDPKARLRALASDGGEVWVGGDRGVLYHSTDSGNTWNKVPVDRITGDIIRLVINGDTLQISTSAGQTMSLSHQNLSETPVKPNSR